ncbi:MAG TPA: hypothetical protein HA346_03850 [Thermoplasmata archaeon]|nr:hypothetical protein [Thermoplasmata archaeon]
MMVSTMYFHPHVIADFIIIALSLLITIEIWRNYKMSHHRASIMLLVFMIWFVVAYSEQVAVVFLTRSEILESGSQIHRMMTGTCFTVGAGVAAAAATLFAILTLKPRHMKFFCALPVAVAVVHFLLWAIFGEIQLQEIRGLAEWVPSSPLKGSTIVIAIMAFVPAILFLVYGMSIHTFRQKVSGITLGAGFLILAFFVFVSDNFSLAPSILYRRICIAAGIFTMYLGFITPKWYLNLVKKGELAIKAELKKE